MRIGILGAAAIAPLCVIDPAAVLGHKVVAVAARDSAKAQAFAETYGVTTVLATYDDVIDDPNVDLVYNPLPNSAHAEWNIKALNAGKHVLAEKPFSSNVAEAQAVIEAARNSKGVLIEAYHYFHHPVMQRTLSLLNEGRIGEILHVEVHMVSVPPADGDLRWSADLAGGALMDMGCYGIHMMQRLNSLCGGAPVPEAASLTMDPRGVDAASTAVLRYPNGATASVWSEFRGHRDVLQFTIYGSSGRLIAPNFVLPHDDDRLILETAGGTWTERLGTRTSYTYQLETLISHIDDGADFPLTLDDTMATMEVVDWILANGTRHPA
ncbi:Gfo/Idh/MocA family protein [Mycolicibacterium sp. P9-22]|uniref:Gfo/Idh/MocA family protein n=1 Tax=Mycolicibacterium sp. P9-22 TaxID=2024613 RepID=UPI001D15667F|nr:Gfo/Idh/MocA family oxidoreductase [Mycolicibacterium sp. P9-22]